MAADKEKTIAQAEKYIQAGKLDKAIKEYERLVQEDPTDMRVRLKVADLQAKSKEFPQAIKSYMTVAESYRQDNFYLKAIAVYKTVLKLSPTMVDINEKLGDLYHKVGLESDAINQYSIAASAFDNKGLFKESLQIRQKIVDVDPSNTATRIRLAEILQFQGKTEEALREYEKVSEILFAKKDREGMIEVYEKMLYYKPDNFPMLLKLTHLYFEKKDFKKIIKKFESLSNEGKEDLDVLENWGEALLEDRQADAARRKFKDAYVKSLESKDIERSARLYSRILQEFNDDQDYLNEIQEAQKTMGTKSPATTAPKHRQDFEKTEVIDLRKLDELLKKKKNP